ncbi:MAG: hypothetical protein AAGI71_05985 [Bacteroidota bacterium]
MLDRLRALFTAPGRLSTPNEPPPNRSVAITICVLTSTMLWFTFSMREDYTRIQSVPLQLVAESIPSGEALSTMPAEEVRVEFVANGYELLQMAMEDPLIEIDGSETVVNMREAAQMALIDNITINSVTPRELILAREERVQRRVPIALRGTLDIPATHGLTRAIQLSPDSVTISGAASHVNQIEAWPTEALVTTTLTDTLITELTLSDTLSGLIQKSVTQTTLHAPIGLFSEDQRTFDVQLVDVPTQDRPLVNLVPSRVTVSYRVLLDHLDLVAEAPDFFVTVSFADILGDSNGQLVPIVNLPSGLVVEKPVVSPAYLRYFFVIYENDTEPTEDPADPTLQP